MMKGIIIFYKDSLSKYADEKVFSGCSSRDLSAQWAKSLNLETEVLESSSLSFLLCDMKKKVLEHKADFVIFSYDDLPFLDSELTKKMIESHIEYKAEYTYADGYPYGFSAEIIDSGTLSILSELAGTSQKALGDLPVSRDSIYNLIKTDINSFEVEAELAPEDWRLYRFAFHCSSKDNFLQSKALFEKIQNKNLSSNEKAELASKTLECLKTVPGFYNIQIADKVSYDSIYSPYKQAFEEKFKLAPVNANTLMSYEKFSTLIDQIASFSEKAVVSLSAWGEALYNPDCLKMIEKVLSYEGLSVFIESDGLNVNQAFCDHLKSIVEKAVERTNGWQKVMFALNLDSFTSQTYVKLHEGAKEGDFQKVFENVSLLQAAIPGMVYPQFVRINENEEELENFFRFWNEKTNPAGGNFIIQKYDDFAGLLPSRKPADLSPVERIPCWHLRRDMTILSNGDVPSCRTYLFAGITGNVFEDSLEKIWHKTDEVLQKHIEKQYINKCERCDEFYTYNF